MLLRRGAKRNRVNSKVLNPTLIFLLAIVLVVAATGVVLYYQLRTDRVSTAVDQGRAISVLFTVHDEGTAVMSFILFYDPVTTQAGILDIPGNMGALIRSQNRVDAIDSVFNPNDPTEFRRVVAELTGAEIPFWVAMSREQLSGFVDLLGGIELFVVNDYFILESEDPILLPSGNVRLDGPKALEYLTLYDPAESALEEVERRQSFVQALLREMYRQDELLRHPQTRRLRRELMNSNLEDRALIALFTEIGRIQLDSVVRRRVQGNVRNVEVGSVSKALLFPHFEGQWLKQTVTQILQSLSNADEVGVESLVVVVEVLNGTLSSGLARRTAQLYEQFGFSVHRFGNADDNQIEHTMVIDRRGVGNFAERAAQVIGARRVVTDVLPETDVDVTVVLGRDFDGTTVRNGSDSGGN